MQNYVILDLRHTAALIFFTQTASMIGTESQPNAQHVGQNKNDVNGEICMKFIHLYLLSLIAAATCLPQSLNAISLEAKIICTSGSTLISIAGALWAQKKIKALDMLSDHEKNKPEHKKTLARLKIVRNVCGLIGIMGIGPTISLYRQYAMQARQWTVQEAFRTKNADRTCGICRKDCKARSKLSLGSPSKRCPHLFHRNCINRWHSERPVCPVCQVE